MPQLILITGDLAAGKSTLALKLSKKLNSLCLIKDTIKEVLSDDIGFTNRSENKKLSYATISVMYYVFRQYAFLNQDLILEANFHDNEIENFQKMADEFNYKIKILYLEGDIDELFNRFVYRMHHENRHPTHCTGDLTTKENFTEYVLNNRREIADFDKIIIPVKGDNFDEVYQKALKALEN